MDKNFNKKRLRNKCAMTCVGKKVLSLGRESKRSSETSYAYERGLKHELINCESSPEFLSDKVFSRFTYHFSLRKTAFTLAEGATHVANWNNSRKIAFTLAEVLITLGIIGVVAALTIPTLMANHRRKVTATRLKQSYNILYNAIKASEAENGSWLYWDAPEKGGNTKEFAEKYILPYLKYTDVGENTVFDGIPVKYYIKLVNGTTVGLSMGLCLDFVVDINGEKAPNKWGYDQFDFLLNIKQSDNGYPKEFGPKGRGATRETLLQKCGGTSLQECAGLIELDGWEIAKDYPHRI